MNRAVFLILIALLMIGLFYVFSRNKVSNLQQPSPPAQNSQSESTSTPSIRSPQKGKIGEQVSFPAHLQQGFQIGIFAKNLGQARDLVFSPGGTLLVSIPSSGEVVAMPDKNNDGMADSNKVVISGENHPHGLAFYNGKLYVADVNQVVRYNWDETNLVASKDKVLFSLPENRDHNNHTITFDSSGKMYVSVGSTCNVCIENSNLSATVLVSDADGNNPRVFAKGLRNAPFIQFNPKTHELWGTEMGRDFLGDNLPPDEINIIKEGNPSTGSGPRDYGWPYCFGDKVYDSNFGKQSPSYCQKTEAPIFNIAAHSAPLGLTFINSSQFPQDWQGDLLVSYHGSWNRSSPIGYKVVHLKVDGNSIKSEEDFLTGFIPSSATSGNSALGRPVDLIFDKEGSLYISDDKAGAVYKITKN